MQTHLGFGFTGKRCDGGDGELRLRKKVGRKLGHVGEGVEEGKEMVGVGNQYLEWEQGCVDRLRESGLCSDIHICFYTILHLLF